MKLVLCYTAGDGCSWHQDVILPIEYESEEALICDFDSVLVEAKNNRKCSFMFGTEEFDVRYFYYSDPVLNKKTGHYEYKNENKILPEIFTLENWFQISNIYP